MQVNSISPVGKTPMKKALEVQEQSALAILRNLEETTRLLNAKKTGLGYNLDIMV